MIALEAQVELLGVVSDVTRLRLLHLLSAHELSVGELVQITGLGQSRVSTHLGRLRDHDLVLDRRVGTSGYYRFNEAGASEQARRLWSLLASQVDDGLLEQDRARALRVVQAREGRWPEALAGEMERHYSPGRTWDSLARAMVGLMQLGDVLDLGSGDGSVAQLLSPRARTVTCVDRSERLLGAASGRLSASDACVRYVQADVQRLPFGEASFDHVLFLNTLVHLDEPAEALAEASRVLRPQGSLVLVTLSKHPHLEVAAQFGHRQAGFETAWLRRRLRSHGMTVHRCERSSRERRRPHFEIITCFAEKNENRI